MINLLKIDIYKMFKSKSFYIIGIILIIIIGLLNATIFSSLIDAYHKLGNVSPDSFALQQLGIENSALKIASDYLNFIMPFCFIFIAIFTCSEFSFGTIKNIASKGYHRETIYLSKFICGIVATIIYTVLTIVTTLILAVTIVGNKIPHFFDIPLQFFPSIFLILLTSIACLSFVLMIASLIRSTGASIGTFFIINTFAPLLLSKIDDFLEYVVETKFSITKYSLLSLSLDAAKVLGQPSIPRETLNLIIYSSIGFLVVTSGVGLYFFKKRDLY